MRSSPLTRTYLLSHKWSCGTKAITLCQGILNPGRLPTAYLTLANSLFYRFSSPATIIGCSTRPFYGRNSIDFRCGEPYRWSQSAVRASYPQEVCRVHGRARFNPSIPTVDPKGVSGRDWPQSFRVQTNLRLEKTTPFDPQDFS